MTCQLQCYGKNKKNKKKKKKKERKKEKQKEKNVNLPSAEFAQSALNSIDSALVNGWIT